ncbi:DUF202 domain-containing protein [Streptomyces sp. NPDC088354]|uniref:DUF202 domain-containing protein n=1 Tax=unclassified Streptomyces TaxID=2593676 RepID=UPI0029A39BEB|nr:DUF202 domain-containing protein [Streptomyces sp. MI02-7b]MDX3075082.1 DUF202 domain-containing protein [Streptomyces sp. MI02-7b]
MDAGRTPSRDPGLQPERTRLAWRRTTLAFAVAALLAGRESLLHGVSAGAICEVAVCALVWLAFTAVAQRRIAVLDDARPPVLSVPWAAWAGLCVLVLVLLGSALLFL